MKRSIAAWTVVVFALLVPASEALPVLATSRGALSDDAAWADLGPNLFDVPTPFSMIRLGGTKTATVLHLSGIVGRREQGLAADDAASRWTEQDNEGRLGISFSSVGLAAGAPLMRYRFGRFMVHLDVGNRDGSGDASCTRPGESGHGGGPVMNPGGSEGDDDDQGD